MPHKWKNKVTALLLLVMLFNILPVDLLTESAQAAQVKAPATINGEKNSCGYNLAVDGPIPEHVKPCSNNGFKFNSKFYYQTWILNNNPKKTAPPRNLIVYGSPEEVTTAQGFKKGMQDAAANVINPKDGEGHFYVYDKTYGRMVFGEWRFLGYDEGGTLYPNDHFIRDSGDTTTQPVDKRWIYEPWKNLPDIYKYKPGSHGAVYGGDSPTDIRFDKLKLNIDRSIGFNFANAPTVMYSDRDRILPKDKKSIDVRNFMNIGQEPTVWEPGIGMMYHWHPVKKQLFYQSFPLLQLEPAEKKQVKAACKVEPVSNKPVPLGKERFVEVEVRITGTLHDEDYIGVRDLEAEFYTRKDIDYWKLEIEDALTKKNIVRSTKVKGDGAVLKENTATAVYKLRLDTETLHKNADKNNDNKEQSNKLPNTWTFPLQSKALSFFANHSEATPSFVTTTCAGEIQFMSNPNGHMKSDFNLIPEIHIEKSSDLSKEMLGYIDYSYGKDVDYYTFEISSLTDSSKKTVTFNPAVPEIRKPEKGYLDQEAVSKFLNEFIKEKFPNEVVRERVKHEFEVRQTIVDQDVKINNKSTAIKKVTVIHNPSIPESACSSGEYHLPQFISPNADWPFDWYDIVPFPVKESPPNFIPAGFCDDPVDYASFAKRVTIDGNEIDADRFISGQFIFGEELQGIRNVTMYFIAPDGSESSFTRHVVVHESKPQVSIKLEGLYKQNRTMRAYDRSAASNDAWTEANAPLEITSFSFVKPNEAALKCRTSFCESNLSEKLFMYKEPGIYQISIAAKRIIPYGNGQTIIRYSDPYVVDYEILPDNRPAIIAHAFSEQISRLDGLPLFYDTQSTDGDFIAEKKLQIFYDSAHDGNFNELVYETDKDIDELPIFDQLGQYQIVVEAKEGTNEERLLEFITDQDNKRHIYYGYFSVDNYAPFSHLYLDTPAEMAAMDIYFLLDKNLKQQTADYIKSNRVSLVNDFTRSNIRANIGIWDMKTYTYEEAASTYYNTGSATPPLTLSYTSPDGYSGTLTRSSISDSPYSRDEGRYVTVTDPKTQTDTCYNDVYTYYDENGNFKTNSSWSQCDATIYYNDGQYKGTLSKNGSSPLGASCGAKGPANGSCVRTWVATYSGTVNWTYTKWEPNMVSYHDYTGFYKGNIYKDVRQSYDAGFMTALKNKQVVYITDHSISEWYDVQKVLDKHDAAFTIIGKPAAKEQLKAADIAFEYLENDSETESMLERLIEHMAKNNPAVPKTLKLVGDTVKTYRAQFDYENDKLPAEYDLLQITHDPNYFDNSLGTESFAGQRLIAEKKNSNWHQYEDEITLSKPGRYMFYRKIKDKPSDRSEMEKYSYESNEAAVEVIVHRRPIADVSLDFDYIPQSNTYQTQWIDRSYDLDHNITRAATDRGIQDRSVRFMNKTTGEVFTVIPDQLSPGTYELDYIVQDIEGEWSDPVHKQYILPDIVPVQMKSNLKTAYEGFSLKSVPASEQLVAYDLWTRYPYEINLQLELDNYIRKTVVYYTGSKQGNDIFWKDEILKIPDTTPDGLYTFYVRGIGSAAGSREVHQYTVRVVTPIQLKSTITKTKKLNESEISVVLNSKEDSTTILTVNETYNFIAETTKYPDEKHRSDAVTVTLFKGSPYQKTYKVNSELINSQGFGKKKWLHTQKIGAMPNGRYVVEWKAVTPNGNVESVNQTVQIINNRPPTADFTWEPVPVYEGDSVQFRSIVDDPDKDKLLLLYELTSPSGKTNSFNYSLEAPYPLTAPIYRMIEPGNWSMKLTVSDGKAPEVVVSKIIQVLPLSVQGKVRHTDRWDELRKAYNLRKSGKEQLPRDYQMFWAGEKFLVYAVTSKTITKTVAEKVIVRFEGREYELKLESSQNMNWHGEIWHESFKNIKNGLYSFFFTAYYNNGTVKEDKVQVQIEGNTAQITGVHRVQ